MNRNSVILFSMLLVGLAACMHAPHHVTKRVQINTPLVIQPVHMDMGEVIEGKKAEATLFLRNTGAFPVHVARVESSCGCTTATPDSSELAPGAFTPLHVRVDTIAKRGTVKKNITVFDTQGRKTQAWLTLTVKPNPHLRGIQGKGIFDGQCVSCHYKPAKGKVTGAAIYRAVCAMCHGKAGKGAYAPVLRGRDTASITMVLTHGLGRQMPAFARDKDGPLNQKQIASVSKWLSELDD